VKNIENNLFEQLFSHARDSSAVALILVGGHDPSASFYKIGVTKVDDRHLLRR
jgi:hypothetical protein